MSTVPDLTTLVVHDHESLGFPGGRGHSLELFRDSVVRPSLLALDAKIDDLRSTDEPGDDFLAEDLAELFQATVEGYLLTVQSMWERGLRSLLIGREKRLHQGARITDIERANWGSSTGGQRDLHGHFERLMGLPLQSFGEIYQDLDLLQSFGNAIRHGDGDAARRVHGRCPSLWWNWVGPGEVLCAGPFHITVPLDAAKHPAFDDISLPEQVLEQMIQSVIWFWEDLENLRCNAFANKAPSVQARLAAWPAKRTRRAAMRTWSPG